MKQIAKILKPYEELVLISEEQFADARTRYELNRKYYGKDADRGEFDSFREALNIAKAELNTVKAVASQISALFNTEEIREIFKDTTVTKFELLVNNGKPFMCEGDCSNIINKGDWYCKEVFPDGNVLDRCLFCSSAIMSNVNNKCFKALIPDQKQEVCPELKEG